MRCCYQKMSACPGFNSTGTRQGQSDLSYEGWGALLSIPRVTVGAAHFWRCNSKLSHLSLPSWLACRGSRHSHRCACFTMWPTLHPSEEAQIKNQIHQYCKIVTFSPSLSLQSQKGKQREDFCSLVIHEKTLRQQKIRCHCEEGIRGSLGMPEMWT